MGFDSCKAEIDLSKQVVLSFAAFEIWQCCVPIQSANKIWRQISGGNYCLDKEQKIYYERKYGKTYFVEPVPDLSYMFWSGVYNTPFTLFDMNLQFLVLFLHFRRETRLIK